MTVPAQKKPKTFYYRAFGLSIGSHLRLPELEPLRATPRKPSILIRRLPDSRQPFFYSKKKFSDRPGDPSHFYWKNESALKVGRGRHIDVCVVPGADLRQVRLSVLGPAFARLLFQRGLLVLHGGAVSDGNGAAAFIGGSGLGKSTLTATLSKKGFRVLTDNLLAIQFRGRKAFVLPSFPSLKLNADSLRHLGRQVSRHQKIEAKTTKRWLSLNRQYENKPRLLKRVYFLEKGSRVGLRSLPAGDAFKQLVSHSFIVRYPGSEKNLVAHLRDSQQLIRTVPFKALRRSSRLSRLPDLVDCVIKDWLR